MPRELKWTPGPWRVAENEWNAKPHEPWTDAIKIEGDVDGPWAVPPLICVTYRGDETDSNARLIAAAPELYDALYEAATLLSAFVHEDTDAIAAAVLGQARVALAKARSDAA